MKPINPREMRGLELEYSPVAPTQPIGSGFSYWEIAPYMAPRKRTRASLWNVAIVDPTAHRTLVNIVLEETKPKKTGRQIPISQLPEVQLTGELVYGLGGDYCLPVGITDHRNPLDSDEPIADLVNYGDIPEENILYPHEG